MGAGSEGPRLKEGQERKMQTCSLRPSRSPQPLGFAYEFGMDSLTWGSSASAEPGGTPRMFLAE